MKKITEFDIENIAIDLLKEQGYQYFLSVDPLDNPHVLRISPEEFLLSDVLKKSMCRINPDMPTEAIEDDFNQVKSISFASLVDENEGFHKRLIEVVKVSDRKGSETRGDFVRLIDFKNPENNEFYVINQFTFNEWFNKSYYIKKKEEFIMKFKEVNIFGFRSIEEMKISFKESGHKVLVGKNESGKSNILKALNLLSKNAKLEATDKKEQYEETPHVRFSFDLEEEEINKIKESFLKKFQDTKSEITTKGHTIGSFFEEFVKSIIFEIHIDSRKFGLEATLKDLKIKDNWFAFNEDPSLDEHPNETGIQSIERYKENVKNIKYINRDFGKDKELKTHLEPLTLNTIRGHLLSTIKNVLFLEKGIYDASIPGYTILDWKYNSKEHDLPPTVNKNNFSDNPDICIPLKNMFLLAGIQKEEIGKQIQDANNLYNSIKNLL